MAFLRLSLYTTSKRLSQSRKHVIQEYPNTCTYSMENMGGGGLDFKVVKTYILFDNFQ